MMLKAGTGPMTAAFTFPGQGSQAVGMGKTLAEAFPAAKAVFDADGVTLQQFSEPAGGQVVFHLHVHVIPRKDNIALKPPASIKEETSMLTGQALKLAAALTA